MTIALLLCTFNYGDARPQLSPVPSMSVVNGSVTCGAIEAQILSQTPLLVANSCTTKIRAVRVSNTLVVHHECKISLFTADHCSLRLQLLKTESVLRVLLSAVATQFDQDKVPENDHISPYYGYNFKIFWMTRSILCYNMAKKKLRM